MIASCSQSYAKANIAESGYFVYSLALLYTEWMEELFPADLFITNITTFIKAQTLTFLKWTHINQPPETDVHTWIMTKNLEYSSYQNKWN